MVSVTVLSPRGPHALHVAVDVARRTSAAALADALLYR
jgi:hypothetical protein